MSKFVFPFLLSMAVLAIAQQRSAAPTHASTAAQKPAEKSSNLPTEEEVNGFMHATFGFNPQMTWKIVDIKPAAARGLAEVTVQISGPEGQGGQRFFVTEDGKHALVGDIIPFGKRPFDAALAELKRKANGPARGPGNAPVLLVEFTDLQCPHCKEANPTISRLLNENSNIRFVSQLFPLPSHNWAAKAAAYAECVGRASNEAYWKFVDGVFEQQEQITAENAEEKLTGIADNSGVKGSDVAACSTKPETQTRVDASLNLGKALGVNSTPTLFVNGRPVGVGNNNYDALKQLVDFAATDK
jgi:protein-disulfide isomerase